MTLNLFALLFFCFSGLGLVTGKIYSRGLWSRDSDPLNYWLGVLGYLLIGLYLQFGM